MVLNILDVQKLEDAKMKIEFVDFSINSCLFDALNQVKLLYERKSITVENSIPNNLTVKGDAEIVQRVFINLLTNAIKYTPNNGIICFTYPQGFQNLEGFVRVQISDNGQGITSDKLNSVFDKFVQIDAKKSGGIRSTGIGLTFCKLAVEAHGGQIGVESTILDLSGEKPTILRFGQITRSELENVLKTEVFIPEMLATTTVKTAGMMSIHYAPTTPAMCCDSDLFAELLKDEKQKIGVLTCGSNIASTENRTVISLSADSVIYAQNLYAKLRELDALNLDLILVEQPPKNEMWDAINDRLSKATRAVL